MRNPGGYATMADPTPFQAKGEHPGIESLKRFGEADTITCGHCQFVVHLPVKGIENVVGGCRVCDRMICMHCVDKGTCTPWEEAMAKREAKDAARRSYGI